MFDKHERNFFFSLELSKAGKGDGATCSAFS